MALKAFDARGTRGRLSGRKYDVADPFEYDYEQISGHVILMRLLAKRQVFSWRTVDFLTESRLSHTATVARVANALADDLELNPWLTAAIALCHDVGHCPYGHLGEIVLNHHLSMIGQPDYDHGVVAPYILWSVAGLDLSLEVLEGITWHGTSSGVFEQPVLSEYRVVAIADKIAYTISDAGDALAIIRHGFYPSCTTLTDKEAGELYSEIFGYLCDLGRTDQERYQNLIGAVVSESMGCGEVSFSQSQEAECLMALRKVLHNGFYSKTDLPEDVRQLDQVIEKLKGSAISPNPYLLFALMIDDELQYLDHRFDSCVSDQDLAHMQVIELNLPDRDDFTFLTFAERFLGV